MRIPAALLAAVAGPTVIFVGWMFFAFAMSSAPVKDSAWAMIASIALATAAVSAAHVLVLGLPAFLILRGIGLARGWSLTGIGFALGALPMALLTWPVRGHGASGSVNGVEVLVDGMPTLSGWLLYAQGVGFMAALGAVGGLCFWLVWRQGPEVRADRSR